MKERVKDFAGTLGVDDVGFAAVEDYRSTRSPAIQSIFPGAKSLVVLAYRELSTCDSDSMQIAMAGRTDVMQFSRSCNYRLARFFEKDLEAKAMTVPPSYPLPMSYETLGSVADVSLRHAAAAAGLGNFGRHNLVIHPELGTRVIFTAVITDLEFDSDPPVKMSQCDDCDVCVESCPTGALDEEGKTDDLKCLKASQPYGIGGHVRFWSKFAQSPVEEQKRMVKDVHYWRLYQAGFIGFQYFCFNCLKSCPVGQE